jgi:cytosine/adenosine deaminase-related metal-dependent hydrolase
LPQVAAFDEVAALYDQQSSPMLILEERFLPGLLPDLRGRDVVEVGCGTGRWLAKLEGGAPRSLIGVDPSTGMLDCARKKLPTSVSLLEGSADALPLATGSADVILISFALSYCERLDRVVSELARIARPGASVLISDVHPISEAKLNWKRTFPSRFGPIHAPSVRHKFSQLTQLCVQAGFQTATFLELPFAVDDWPIFAAAGKLPALEAMRGLPAIYIAQFTKDESSVCVSINLKHANIAFGPTSSAAAMIAIGEDRVAELSTALLHRRPDHAIDLSGYLVMPGLINAHDHLEFGLFPRLGRGGYQNSKQWAEDIHTNDRDLIALHSRVPKDVRLYWGALRNLLSGVTTVCHHNPISPVLQSPDFPVRVMRDFGWAHSLAFDSDLPSKFASTSNHSPFVIHAAEGVDEQTSNEIAQLERLGILGERTILVHGLNCSSGDIDLINHRGTALVVCPSSNDFLFGTTWTGSRLHQVSRFVLGTDSPISASGDMLDEIRFSASKLELSPTELYEMCTSRSAAILRLHQREGTIRAGGVADFLAVRDNGLAPASRLLELRPRDIELVFVGGRVHLASEEGLQRLPDSFRQGLFPLAIDGSIRWVRAPLPHLFREAQAVLGDDLLLGHKQVTYAG